jgi:short/branched chain acyl-CoA dehydrogenase
MNFDLTPDQEQLQARVRDFAQAEVAPVAEKLDRDGVFPTALYKQLGDLGVMSIPFAEKDGGMGLGVFDAVLALEEVARADQSLAVSAVALRKPGTG